MRLGVFFDSRRLGSWDWQAVLSGDAPVSGTDGQLLEISAWLQDHHFEIHFLSQHDALNSPCAQNVLAGNLAEAVEYSRSAELPVLVFVNHGHPETIRGMQHCQKIRQPSVAWDQNGPDIASGRVAWACSFVRRLVCVSSVQADVARDQRVFKKISVIHNSLPPRSFVANSALKIEQPNILYVGSLTPSKGFHHLARVWQNVRRRHPSATLVVAGNGRLYDRSSPLGPLGVASPEYEETLMPYAGSSRQEALLRGIDFRGLLSPNETRQLASCAMAGVVNPNMRGAVETFCVAAVELQAYGLPVIGAKAGGLKETILDGQSGYLVQNDSELESKICVLLDNPQIATRMGTFARNWTQSLFNRERIGEQWIRLLRAVADNEPNVSVPLTLKRLDIKVAARECIRKAQSLPWLGDRVPSLSELANRLGRSRSSV
jgi:glycosyltransferase involved in cell wall biosynthesis